MAPTTPAQVEELRMGVSILGGFYLIQLTLLLTVIFNLHLTLKRGAEEGGGVFPPCT